MILTIINVPVVYRLMDVISERIAKRRGKGNKEKEEAALATHYG